MAMASAMTRNLQAHNDGRSFSMVVDGLNGDCLPEEPVVEEHQIEHVIGGRRRGPRRAGRCVQVATALRAALLRRRAAMSAIAEAGRHLLVVGIYGLDVDYNENEEYIQINVIEL